MSTVALDTGFNIEIDFELAPFHKRLLAWIIDFIIRLLYILVIVGIIEDLLGFYATQLWVQMILFLPVYLYYLVFETLTRGQSPGKIIMKVQIISEAGGSPSFNQYFIRWIFRLLDVTFLGIPAVLSIIFSPRSQRLGDLSAGTVLISTSKDLSWKDTIFEQLQDNYRPRYPEVMRLSDNDINTLKKINQTISRRKGDTRDLAWTISEKIKTSLGIKTSEAPEDFLQTLLTDYNYYTQRGGTIAGKK